MKKLISIGIMLLSLTGYAYAIDLNFDGYGLYSLSDKTTSIAPGVNTTIITVWDKVFALTIDTVFPAQNRAELPKVIVGPMVGTDILKLIAKIPGCEVVALKDVKISAGVLMDVPSISHKQMKEYLFPGIHVRIVTP